MGESPLDAPKDEYKMGDSGANDLSALQVSVSFGRFENDSLCWEKWSTFPTNKYLEEVEKCSTPGSVAQKKAYFEAHYKKIAALKIEQLQDQDKKRRDGVSDPVGSEEQDRARRDLPGNLTVVQEELDVNQPDVKNSVEGDEVNNSTSRIDVSQMDEPKDDIDIANEIEGAAQSVEDAEGDSYCRLDSTELHESGGAFNVKEEVINSTMKRGHSRIDDEQKSDPNIAKESKDSLPIAEDAIAESCALTTGQDLHKSEEATLVKEEATLIGPQELVNLPKSVIDEAREDTPKDIAEKVKLQKSTISQKATTGKTGPNMVSGKKKPVSSTLKSPLIATPKLSRPTSSKSVMSESKASSKKENGVSPLTSKKSAKRVESKRTVPMSLHMSLSLDPANSESAPGPAVRKSLIMERMGDKDIVKRAFKAFQKNFNQLSSSNVGKPVATSRVYGNDKKPKGSVVGTPPKTSEGLTKSVKKASPQVGQPGLRKASVSPGLPNTLHSDRRNVKTASSPYGLRNHDKSDKRKEASKKLEDKSNGKAVEKSRPLPKAKVEKEAESKMLPQQNNTRTKPLLSSVASKSSLHKRVGKA